MKKKKVCKHKWQIIPYQPSFTIITGGGSGSGGGITNDAIAVCQKCLEKKYI